MLTQEYINDLFLTAHMADRTDDHRRELAYANKMQAEYDRQHNIVRKPKQQDYVTPVKIPTPGYKATSIEDALNKMEELLGYK